MNPNSQHQLWSKWTFKVIPGRQAVPSFEDVRTNCARFGRKAFGSAGQMRVQHVALPKLSQGCWQIEVLVEGAPVQDEELVASMCASWRRFFFNGFGDGTRVECSIRPMAGDFQNGEPPEQLIIIPPLVLQ